MKTLLLLRHAKSSWKDESLTDHDRPLNKRGKKTAPLMGHLLREKNLVPDLVVSSTAVRARSTAEAAAEACGYPGEITLTDELYLATAGEILRYAQEWTAETLGRVGMTSFNRCASRSRTAAASWPRGAVAQRMCALARPRCKTPSSPPFPA